MVATFLIERTRNEMAPPLYLMAAALISAIFTLSLRETTRIPLAD